MIGRGHLFRFQISKWLLPRSIAAAAVCAAQGSAQMLMCAVIFQRRIYDEAVYVEVGAHGCVFVPCYGPKLDRALHKCSCAL